jgi:hypothetical protein
MDETMTFSNLRMPKPALSLLYTSPKGVRHSGMDAGMTGFTVLVYNDESRRLETKVKHYAQLTSVNGAAILS